MSGPDRVGETWAAGGPATRFVAVVVASYVCDGVGYGREAGQWVHRALDLAGATLGPRAALFEVEERVLSDPSSGWFRLA